MKKQFRVKKSSEIESIIKHKDSLANRYFVVYKKENHDINHFRFAVSVSKKFGNAVQRNKIKRQVREIIADLSIKPLFDIFIIVRNRAIEASFQSLESSLRSVLQKHKIIEVNL